MYCTALSGCCVDTVGLRIRAKLPANTSAPTDSGLALLLSAVMLGAGRSPLIVESRDLPGTTNFPVQCAGGITRCTTSPELCEAFHRRHSDVGRRSLDG